MTDWTPVSEALPRIRAFALCQHSGGKMDVLMYRGDLWWVREDDGICGDIVAWQPLPAPYVAPAAPAAAAEAAQGRGT